MIARPGELDDSDDRIPCVPFVPFRCYYCGKLKPFTSNVRGRLRMHHCKHCNRKYRSWELGPEAVPDWKGIPPSEPQGAQSPS